MKILLKYFGDHSNRLMQLAHIEAACKEYNQKFVNLCFSDMAKYYEKPNVPLIYNYRVSYFILRAILKVQRIFGFKWLTVYQYNDVSIDYDKTHLCMTKHAIIYGFYFRVPELVQKYKSYFQSAYKLKSKYYINNGLFLKLNSIDRIKCDIVAIHCRRGDYKDWGGVIIMLMMYIQVLCNRL